MKRIMLFMLGMLLATLLRAETMITAEGDPWPPFLDPDHPAQGVATELVTAAFASQGYELKLTFRPWARAIANVKSGAADVLIGTWWTQERTSFLAYSEPYIRNEIKFIKRREDTFEYQGLESLKDKTVGTVRGYGYGDDFNAARFFTKEETPALLSSIRKVIAGRIDLSLEDELVARSLITKEDPKLLDQIAFTQNALSSQTLHVSSGLKNPRHKELIDAFNKGLTNIKTNGTYDAIMRRNGLK